MNLLEAFHFIFEADASKLEEGLKKAESTNDKLKKGVDDTDKSALKLGETFLSLAKNVATVFAGVVTIGALKAMGEEVAKQTGELDKQAKELNVNASALYDWQGAVVAAGGTAEGFNSTISNLNKITRDPERALLRLSDTFKKLSSWRARKLGEQLGIDAGTSELLRKGRDGVQAMIDRQRELGVVTQEQVAISTKYNDQLRDTNRVFDDVRRRLAMLILPIMTKWLEGLEKTVRWLRDNKAFTIGFFGGIAAIITAVFLPAILSAIAAVYTLLAPFLLVGAAVAAVGAAIGLLVDDIMAFLDGNDSLIGEMSKTWPWIGELVRNTAEEFKALWQLLKDLGGFMVTLFTDPAKAWEMFKDGISNGIKSLAAEFPTLTKWASKIADAFGGAGEIVKNVFTVVAMVVKAAFRALLEGWQNVLSWLPDSVKSFMGIDTGGNEPPPQLTSDGQARLSNLVGTAAENVQNMSANPINTQTSGTIANGAGRNVNKRTDIRVDNIEINTQATDADGISQAIDGSMQRQFANTTTDFDDGFLS